MFNILSFDVEEWFDSHFVPIKDNTPLEKRVDIGVKKILKILKGKNIQSTFFILGRVAQDNPDLVKMIDSQGYEVATHGYSHKPLSCLPPEEFKKDLLLSIKILKDITGKDVLGYRAPGYSITKDTFWALDIIQDCGLKYDSSIYPVSLKVFTHGGLNTNTQVPFFIKKNLVEFPLPTLNILGLKIPVATTAYFRIFPYPITKYVVSRLNQRGIFATLNFHSWEFDAEQPRINLPFPQNIKHYYNLSLACNRLKQLTDDFRFIDCREALHVWNYRNL